MEPIEHRRCDDPRLPEAGNERRGAPVAVRHGGDETRARRAPPVAPAMLVAVPVSSRNTPSRGVQEALPDPPAKALGRDLGSILLGRPPRPLLCLSPSRRSVLWIVESPAARPKRRSSSAWSSASVIPGVAATSRRSSASCGASSGRRWPPQRAGAGLPVARTRCISLIAAAGLTGKRRAAPRIELPRSTARTIRSRRSNDIGARLNPYFRIEGLDSTQ
jgi:hypothetical protein